MKFLTVFEFDKLNDAVSIHQELFKIVLENGYITYADIYRLIHKNGDVLPAFYEHWGWNNLDGCRVEVETSQDKPKLILPPIKNIENLIKSKGE